MLYIVSLDHKIYTVHTAPSMWVTRDLEDNSQNGLASEHAPKQDLVQGASRGTPLGTHGPLG